MAPQPLPTTQRYINPEVTTVYLVPEIADLDAPERSELDDAESVDLTPEIAAMTGWEVSTDRVAVPDLATRKTGRISGRINPGDASITFYASDDTEDVRTVIQRGDRTNIVILDGGDVDGQSMRVFAVEVSAVTPTVDVAGSEAARVMVDFAINDWAESAVVPGPAS
ncbi:hypothetical protein [Verrucosispora sp. WMMD1129]|uniref:phage tail tube protein n=1 Tax=Verrucosispora sp. WMMD1129 TaxID=3016093 RepID=UPI00249A0675|nr:hypothetical protein [Verrucosispora sp. WMMD1129]WFE45303.1 hypothetical protein O7624_13560 [Verrucosispora sp. WMMD1129]